MSIISICFCMRAQVCMLRLLFFLFSVVMFAAEWGIIMEAEKGRTGVALGAKIHVSFMEEQHTGQNCIRNVYML